LISVEDRILSTRGQKKYIFSLVTSFDHS